MKRKSILVLSLAVALAVGSLVACGAQNQTASAKPQEKTATASTQTASAAETTAEPEKTATAWKPSAPAEPDGAVIEKTDYGNLKDLTAKDMDGKHLY